MTFQCSLRPDPLPLGRFVACPLCGLFNASLEPVPVRSFRACPCAVLPLCRLRNGCWFCERDVLKRFWGSWWAVGLARWAGCWALCGWVLRSQGTWGQEELSRCARGGVRVLTFQCSLRPDPLPLGRFLEPVPYAAPPRLTATQLPSATRCHASTVLGLSPVSRFSFMLTRRDRSPSGPSPWRWPRGTER